MTTHAYPIVQVAYFVDDIEAAAARMHAGFGAGPFIILRNIELAWGEHRGKPCRFLHSSAYGQWGAVMLELVQQEVEGPSPFRDLYGPGEEGLHHMATMVPSQEQAYAHYTAQGFEVATRARTITGTEFAFVDTTATLGHFIEVYERSPQLLGFYDLVRQAAAQWDGKQLIREL
jgi:hypothetical protein